MSLFRHQLENVFVALSLCRRTIILFYKLEANLMYEKQPPVKRKITDCKLSV